MKLSFSIGNWRDDDKYVRLHLNSLVTLDFESVVDMQNFAEYILAMTPEIVEHNFELLSEDDQAEFDPC